MTKLLVLTQDYPSATDKYSFRYVHTRNQVYLEAGLAVTVLSFSASAPYIQDGIQVLNEAALRTNGFEAYDVVASHAPNLRNHLRFLARYSPRPLVLFFHGHEVLARGRYYPKPYPWQKPLSPMTKYLQASYDVLKLRILKAYLGRILLSDEVRLVFVSDWMKRQFLTNTRLPNNLLEHSSQIIPNTIGAAFLGQRYQQSDSYADFITLRPFDEPKYALDLVLEAAKANPNLSFHVYGKGRFFEHNPPPANLSVHNDFVRNEDIPELLNHYRAALMPTRLDAQGVMMCEMASYGIPLITSDIEICHEMLSDFANVTFDDNAQFGQNLSALLQAIKDMKPGAQARLQFSQEKTVEREIKLFKALAKT